MSDIKTNIQGTSITGNFDAKPATAQTGNSKFGSLIGGSNNLSGSSFGFAASTMVTATANQRMVASQSSSGTAFGAGAAALPGVGDTGGSVAVGGSSFGGGLASGSNPIGAAAGSSSQNQLLDATKQMQETQMSFNLQYLQLQSQMQHENRSYTAVSNIMKTKHDTVKNSISNVR